MNTLKEKNPQQPLVSIRCLVYNHEPFLRDCLEGFVMQQTNFPFEAIVHDDASTDRSADIIREYAAKYPHIIKPVYETENRYSKKDGSLGRVMNAATSPSSKYVAYCEGDDYWTDPQKLQKQVDFMETHPDYTMCFHGTLKRWQNGEQPDSLFGKVEERDYSLTEICEKQEFQTSSVVIRKSLFSTEIYQKAETLRAKYPYGDTILYLTAAYAGKTHGIEGVMSIHRKHLGGLSYRWADDVGALLRQKEFYQEVPICFGRHLRSCPHKYIKKINKIVILTSLKLGHYRLALSTMLSFIKEMPAAAVVFTFLEPIAWIRRLLNK